VPNTRVGFRIYISWISSRTSRARGAGGARTLDEGGGGLSRTRGEAVLFMDAAGGARRWHPLASQATVASVGVSGERSVLARLVRITRARGREKKIKRARPQRPRPGAACKYVPTRRGASYARNRLYPWRSNPGVRKVLQLRTDQLWLWGPRHLQMQE
jgi:hypothetical protein